MKILALIFAALATPEVLAQVVTPSPAPAPTPVQNSRSTTKGLVVDAYDRSSASWEGAVITFPSLNQMELLAAGQVRIPGISLPPDVKSHWHPAGNGFVLTSTSSRGATERTFTVTSDNGDGTGTLSISCKSMWDGKDITAETIGKGDGGTAKYVKKKTGVKTRTEDAIANLLGEPNEDEASGPTNVAKAELTPSPTATPKPIGTNTPDGRQSLKDALRRDPEYAKMSEAELDAFLDKLDHEQLSSWGVSDAMKAEMDWYTSRGLDPSSPRLVIEAATPEPTPHAVIQNPYDWVTHARQESELDSAIKQLHDKMKDALEEHRGFSEKNVEELQQRLEVLRHIRNAAIRSPTRYMPRLPARR